MRSTANELQLVQNIELILVNVHDHDLNKDILNAICFYCKKKINMFNTPSLSVWFC